MIKVFGFMSKRADLTTAAFRDHYEHVHVPLVLGFAAAPAVYRRHYLDGGDPQGLVSPEIGFDVITEFGFESDESFAAWAALAEVTEIIADEETFLDRSRTRAYVIQDGGPAPA